MKTLAITILLTLSIIAVAQHKGNSNVSRNIIQGINTKYPRCTLTKFKEKKDSYKATFIFEGKTKILELESGQKENIEAFKKFKEQIKKGYGA